MATTVRLPRQPPSGPGLEQVPLLRRGAWQPLSKTDWGAWAKSIHVPRGTPVQFRATSTSGATDHSGVQAWLGGATSTATPAPADPDPATPNLSPGVARSVSLGAGGEAFAQVYVKPGVSRLKVEMTGPACGLFGCSFDAALSTRHAAKPTDATHDCRPYLSGNKESCTHAGPQAGWWYVRVESQKGSGTVQVKATVS
jgi:hypothetical protein